MERLGPSPEKEFESGIWRENAGLRGFGEYGGREERGLWKAPSWANAVSNEKVFITPILSGFGHNAPVVSRDGRARRRAWPVRRSRACCLVGDERTSERRRSFQGRKPGLARVVYFGQMLADRRMKVENYFRDFMADSGPGGVYFFMTFGEATRRLPQFAEKMG